MSQFNGANALNLQQNNRSQNNSRCHCGCPQCRIRIRALELQLAQLRRDVAEVKANQQSSAFHAAPSSQPSAPSLPAVPQALSAASASETADSRPAVPQASLAASALETADSRPGVPSASSAVAHEEWPRAFVNWLTRHVGASEVKFNKKQMLKINEVVDLAKIDKMIATRCDPLIEEFLQICNRYIGLIYRQSDQVQTKFTNLEVLYSIEGRWYRSGAIGEH